MTRRLKWTAPHPKVIWRGTVGGGAIGIVLACGWGFMSTNQFGYTSGLVTLIVLIMCLVGSGIGAALAAIDLLAWKAILGTKKEAAGWAVGLVIALTTIGTFQAVLLVSADVFDGTVFGSSAGAAAVAGALAGATAAWAHVATTVTPADL